MTNEESASSLNVFHLGNCLCQEFVLFSQETQIQYNSIDVFSLGAKDVLPTMKDSFNFIHFFSLEKKSTTEI